MFIIKPPFNRETEIFKLYLFMCSRQNVSGIISGVMTGKLRGLFSCLLSGIILFGPILSLIGLLVMLLNGFRR